MTLTATRYFTDRQILVLRRHMRRLQRCYRFHRHNVARHNQGLPGNRGKALVDCREARRDLQLAIDLLEAGRRQNVPGMGLAITYAASGFTGYPEEPAARPIWARLRCSNPGIWK